MSVRSRSHARSIPCSICCAIVCSICCAIPCSISCSIGGGPPPLRRTHRAPPRLLGRLRPTLVVHHTVVHHCQQLRQAARLLLLLLRLHLCHLLFFLPLLLLLPFLSPCLLLLLFLLLLFLLRFAPSLHSTAATSCGWNSPAAAATVARLSIACSSLRTALSPIVSGSRRRSRCKSSYRAALLLHPVRTNGCLTRRLTPSFSPRWVFCSCSVRRNCSLLKRLRRS
ncbi:hypothetical protein T484DRAFT_1934766 [Baffinella frigidus]|nr:hypothetical protein T484DRAFT_1934766 [Cryptophyta sp. CCMP2293]